MRLQVKGRNIQVSPSLRAYAESKLARLDKQLAPDTAVDLELGAETKHSGRTAEATVFTKGPTIRATESTSDIRAAIDQLVANLERQLVRYREKRRQEPRRRTAHHGI
ncbi:MAG TPA: ribosome-associated translation inhibitor RaiA [Gaiellaceae bacterium]